jgi:NitT/TauT family transport system substrate-binding protein
MRILTLFCAALVSGSALAQTPIRFALDWRFEGPAAPYLVAIDKGYYKAEGLDVTIDPGSGSVEGINRVASGAYQVGFADINSLVKYRDNPANLPVKAVLMVYDTPAFSIVSLKKSGIRSPKDLEGKTLGAPAADGAWAQWPIFVQANKIDAGKIKVENVGFPVREPMLQNGQVDAITGFSFSSFINLKSMGVPTDDIVVMLMADYGVNLYGNAIVVNLKFAAEHPDAVKGFLRAFVKGLKETVKQPSTAADSVLRHNDQARKDVEVERLNIAIRDNIVTPEVKTNGYGGIDNARFERAINQIALTYKFKIKPNPDDIFDASYLPAAAVRKFN